MPEVRDLFPNSLILFPNENQTKIMCMKNLIVPLVMFMSVIACEEEAERPLNEFAGTWYLENPSAGLEISFTVVPIGNGVYNIEDRLVVYPAIPTGEQRNNQIRCYEKNSSGYGFIEVASRGDVYYRFYLIDNRIQGDEMHVSELVIDIPSEPLDTLRGVSFRKSM